MKRQYIIINRDFALKMANKTSSINDFVVFTSGAYYNENNIRIRVSVAWLYDYFKDEFDVDFPSIEIIELTDEVFN